jgi:hypothetical protein
VRRLEAGSKSVLLGLGLVHLEVVLVLVLVLVLPIRSAPRLSTIAFRGGLLGVRLALGCCQMMVCHAFVWIFLSHSSMGRSGAPEGCG